VKDANNNVTTSTYDADNRLVKTTYPDGKFDSTAYDAVGRVQSRTDANGNTTQYGYDALGRLTSVTDALNQVTSYGYDEVGNRITQTDANLHTTNYQYDQRGRRIGRTLPGSQSESYAYDLGGNLHTRTDFNGKTTTYGYDTLNRLLSKTPDASFSASPVTFTYTNTGKRQTMADPSGTTTYGYDNRDRLTSKATPEGTLNYTYDLASNLTVLSTAGLAVNYTYDVLNRLATVAEPNTGTTSYSYDAVGNLGSFTTPNGVSHAYTYDSRNRLTNLAVGTNTTPLASYGYTLDAAGHRTSVTELSGRTVNYAYDNIYRLMSETVSGVAASGAVSYTYDAVGNRKTLTSTLAPIQSATSNFDNDDRLSTDGYDPNGNTTQSSGATYTYDFENHLLSTGTISMLYDGDGNRVSKTVNGVTTKYLVDDLNPTGYAQVVVETIGSGETRQFAYGTQRLSQRRSTEIRYYADDGRGSVRLLTDSIGTVTDSYDYDAFGNIVSSTGVTPNEFLFAGEQFDSDLGLYYNRARYLNTATGRLWTMDTYEGSSTEPISLHKYLYAGADPANQTDPSGHEIDEVSTAVAVAVTIGTLAVTAAIAYHFLHHIDMVLKFKNDFFWQDDLHPRNPQRQSLSDAEITLVKQSAVQALSRAFYGFPRVRVSEGGSGDHIVEIDSDYPRTSCGGTRISPSNYSFINYSCILNQAEFTNGIANKRRNLPEIGWGIGTTAAHEIGHQLGLSTVNADKDTPGYYDNHDQSDPLFYIPGGQLRWSDRSLKELGSLLN